jgi:ADP-heptose synthase, bifunctional sugar kinase/adenylyltransferase
MISLDKSQINNLLRNTSTLNICVIGDCMLDHYIWGDVQRISPEAPVPVVNIDKDTYRLGGACNVALNLKQMGCNVSLMGLIGQDSAGDKLRQLLKENDIAISEASFNRDISTIVKTRVIVRNQQLCRLDRESFFTEQQAEGGLSSLRDAIQNFDAVIVSDYNKGTVSQALLELLVDLKKQKNFFLAVDPKPAHELDYNGVDLLKPNRSEALQLSGVSPKPHAPFPLDSVAKRILQRYRLRYLAITLGNEGLALLNNDNEGCVYPAQDREVFDVSGAGDTALAALVVAFCLKMPMEVAATFANMASGIVVGKVGTAAVSLEELRTYVQ